MKWIARRERGATVGYTVVLVGALCAVFGVVTPGYEGWPILGGAALALVGVALVERAQRVFRQTVTREWDRQVSR